MISSSRRNWREWTPFSFCNQMRTLGLICELQKIAMVLLVVTVFLLLWAADENSDHTLHCYKNLGELVLDLWAAEDSADPSGYLGSADERTNWFLHLWAADEISDHSLHCYRQVGELVLDLWAAEYSVDPSGYLWSADGSTGFLLLWSTKGSTGFFFCDQLMKTVTILFSLKTRFENCCLICELQKMALILLISVISWREN